jgi:hypothetical protein
MHEEWRPVVGYEGLYEVSDCGRVRGVERIVGYRLPGHTKRWRARVLRMTTRPNGYLVVSLRRNGRSRSAMVHRLVLEAFVGQCPADHQACHFPDLDKTNNRVTNLRWGTAADNAADRDIHGNGPCGEANGFSKLTEQAVAEIRREYKGRGKGPTLTALANRYGVRFTAIHKVVSGESWQHLKRKQKR